MWSELKNGDFLWIKPPKVEFEGAARDGRVPHCPRCGATALAEEMIADTAYRMMCATSKCDWMADDEYETRIEAIAAHDNFDVTDRPKWTPAQCKAALLQIVDSIMSSETGSAEIGWGPGGIRGAVETFGLRLKFETWD